MYNSLQIRELFHFLFLERLLLISDPMLYVLKGGVNLRFFFQSPRYSEDMDLDVLAGDVSTLKKNGYKILNDPAFGRLLRSYGIESIEIAHPSRAKHTGTTQRFKVGVVTTGGERLSTKIEFSRRTRGDASACAVERIHSDIAAFYHKLPFACQHYSISAAISQKIDALAARRIPQARDLFDLFILKIQLASEHHKHIRSSKKNLNDAREHIHALNYNDYKGHVIDYLNAEGQKQYSSEIVWNEMVNDIEALLSGIET